MPPQLQSFDSESAAAVLRAAHFPRSGEHNNQELVKYAERSVAAWRARGGHDRLQARSIADFLYKAAAKTYHSQRLLRCLMIVLAALGNYTDAARALDEYLDLAAKGRVRAQKGSAFVDIDDPITIVSAAAEGVRMLVRHVKDAGRAKATADVLRGWIVVASTAAKIESSEGKEGEVSEHKKILSIGWTAVGSAYRLAAQFSLDQDERDTSTSQAREALEFALSFDDQSSDSLFEFSFLLASLCNDLPSARSHVGKVLQLQSGNVTAAHLLALVLSGEHKYVEARQVISDLKKNLADNPRRQLSLVEKRMVLQLKMTNIALIEALFGVNKALEIVSNELFGSYNDLFTWGDDTVESQIHEASTSAITPPQSEVLSEKYKKRSEIVPTVAVPEIAVNDLGDPINDANDDDDNDDDDDDNAIGETEEDENVSVFTRDTASSFANSGSTTAAAPAAAAAASSNGTSRSHISEKIPQDFITTSSTIPAAVLAEVRTTVSPKPRSLLSKRSLILPRAIRRRLSDASLRSKKSSRSSVQAMSMNSLVEKHKGGANRVLRNSLSVDDSELKELSMSCLRDVWLLVAGLFRRSERYVEAAAAIVEATKLGGAREDTFAERGFLMQAQGQTTEALDAFEAALTVSVDYVPAIIGLSATLLGLDDKEQPMARDRASVLLESATKAEAWDYGEAWLLLGQALEANGDEARVQEALWRCAELEEARPVRRWSAAWLWRPVS
ncbi:hypothetical protein V1514DRAFT_323354 [Lipomyces japonicus]|uniref:uncharacterized protein n=1 Tax=Lipomyces japonicus TaxID=56871 RepID=UPI0034CE3E81